MVRPRLMKRGDYGFRLMKRGGYDYRLMKRDASKDEESSDEQLLMEQIQDKLSNLTAEENWLEDVLNLMDGRKMAEDHMQGIQR